MLVCERLEELYSNDRVSAFAHVFRKSETYSLQLILPKLLLLGLV